MKVCYFIQSHKNPEQICRLVRVIKQSSPQSQVLINHDFSTSYLDLTSLSNYSGIDLIERKKSARRGGASLLNIYLETIDWLFEHNSDFEWLICLSGQDYPTQSLSKIEDFLSKTEYDGFIRYWDILSKESVWHAAGSRRYFAQYICLPEWTSSFLRKLKKIESFTPIIVQYWRLSFIGLEVKKHPFSNRFKCYGGWYWCTLSRKCVKFLASYLRENPDLLKFYRRTLAPEESIIQTVLLNSKQFNLCNDDKRFVEFPSDIKNGNAQVLASKDYAKITANEFHFARKFDMKQDSGILDLLDAKIIT